jgi:hypothetical protein
MSLGAACTSGASVIAACVGLSAVPVAAHATTPVTAPAGTATRDGAEVGCTGGHQPAASGFDVVQLQTLTVRTSVPRRSYRVGDQVPVKVRVTRPGRSDPLGQGVDVPSPTSLDASGASVGIGVLVKDVVLYGAGRTDDSGRATVRVRLAGYTPRGTAGLTAFAWRRDAQTPCLIVEEDGYTQVAHAFKVRR